jgi:hypothetical protein
MRDERFMSAALPVAGTLSLWARRLVMDPRLVWATLGLIGVLLVGALIIWWVDRWRKRSQEALDSSGDQLAHFRELYEQGNLSAEEFERIRGLLGKRLRQELDVPASGTPEKDSQQPEGPPPAAPGSGSSEPPDADISPEKLP